jgi:hypothetical protein
METLKNVTPLQWLGVVLVINGALIGSTAQLTDLFGAMVTKDIVSVASLGNAVLGGIVTMLSGQGTQVRNVMAMPGIEKITVNSQANSTLAAIAVDDSQPKIEATPAAEARVVNIAKGAA